MALKKTITHSTGHTSDYHRVRSHTVAKTGDVNVKVDTFKDQAAAQTGKEPSKTQTLTLEAPCDASSVAAVYARLKQHPDMADSSDV
jgi:hypothetical protein